MAGSVVSMRAVEGSRNKSQRTRVGCARDSRTLKANGKELVFLMVSVCDTSTVKGPAGRHDVSMYSRTAKRQSIEDDVRRKFSSRGSTSIDMMGGLVGSRYKVLGADDDVAEDKESLAGGMW